MSLTQSNNISSFQVYINGDYYGNDLTEIQINTNDTILFQIVRLDATQVASLVYVEALN